MLSGAFLEDAMVVSCGHSFGGLMLRRVLDMVSWISSISENINVNMHILFFFRMLEYLHVL